MEERDAGVQATKLGYTTGGLRGRTGHVVDATASAGPL